MFMNGCTNPNAVNYNPNATVEDYSCVYLEKYNSQCYAFKDVAPDKVIDKSFTLSYSINGKDWVFFHDYFPDFYFSTKNQLFNLKDRKIYINNKGLPGIYHDTAPKAFFIDAVFSAANEEMILNSVQWISEVINQGKEIEFSTLTHITIWNNQQCTGRIAIQDVFDNLEFEARKTQGVWSFDTFRDMIATYGSKFLLDIFNNFAVDTSKLDMGKPWFDQDLIHDTWCVVRFEFDNVSGNQLVLHSAGINASKSFR